MRRSVCSFLLLAAGCASAPSAFTPRSAASPGSTASPLPAIGRALREEPPAPGAATEGWAGLSTATTPADAHAHHHVMRMPDGTMMEMDAMPSTTPAEDAHAH